jgi:hypothetical protein
MYRRRYIMNQTGRVGQTLADNPNFAIFENDGIIDIYDRDGHSIQINMNYGQMVIAPIGNNHLVNVDNNAILIVKDI